MCGNQGLNYLIYQRIILIDKFSYKHNSYEKPFLVFINYLIAFIISFINNNFTFA